MVECPICKKQYSEFATECPHCKSNINKDTGKVSVSLENLPKMEQIPTYFQYVIAAIFVILSIVSIQISGFSEFRIGAAFGKICLVALATAKSALNLTLLGFGTIIIAMISISIYRFITKGKQSITIFLGLSVVTTLVFYILCKLLPMLFINIESVPNEVAGYVEKLMNSIPLYYTLTIPIYTMISYWNVCNLGMKKGLFINIINFAITVIVLFIRIPVVTSLLLSFEMLYFFAFPLVVDIIIIGISFFMNCLKK